MSIRKSYGLSSRWGIGPVIFVTALIAGCSKHGQANGGPIPPVPALNIKGFHASVQADLSRAYKRVEEKPGDAEANAALGMVYQANDQLKAAETCYTRAHLLQPGSFDWLYLLGHIQHDQGNHSAAVSSFRRALEIDPSYFAAKLALAESLRQLGRLDESGELYRSVLKEKPDSPNAHYGLGRVLASKGDLKNAAEEYRSAITISPAYPAAHYALGLVYRSLNQVKEAETELRISEQSGTAPPVEDPLLFRVVEMRKNGYYLRNRAYAALIEKDLTKAEDLFQKAIALDPNDVTSHLGMMTVFGRQKRPVMAEKEYQLVKGLNPNAPQLDYLYSQIMEFCGRHEAAYPAYLRALKINPYDGGLHNDVGLLLERQGKDAESQQHYELAVKYGPGNSAALSNLGRALVRHGRFEEGIAYHLKSIGTMDERRPKYLFVTALAYDMWGNKDKAIEYARLASVEASGYGQEPIEKAADQLLAKHHALAQPSGNAENTPGIPSNLDVKSFPAQGFQ